MSDKDMKLRLIVEAKNEADAALNDLNADLRQTSKGADQLQGSMSLLGVAAAGAIGYFSVSTIAEFGAAAFNTGVQVDSLNRAMVAISGSTMPLD